MNDNEVSLTIGGSVYKNWTSFSITSELNTISPAFSVGVVSDNISLRKNIKIGGEVQVKIGNDLVLTVMIKNDSILYNS